MQTRETYELTVYRVDIKTTPCDCLPNGELNTKIYGTFEAAMQNANFWLKGAAVKTKAYGGGLMITPCDRDAIEHAEGGVEWILILPTALEINPTEIKRVIITE